MGVVIVGGIHGVGKSTLIDKALETGGIRTVILKGSGLMAEFLKISPEELPSRTPQEREAARAYMYEKMRTLESGIRDGHFCVYTDAGYEFPFNPDDRNVVAIVVLWSEPEEILQRRVGLTRQRPLSLEMITEQQQLEIEAGRKYASKISVPVYLIENRSGSNSVAEEMSAIFQRHLPQVPNAH
jgi:adenylate kinase